MTVVDLATINTLGESHTDNDPGGGRTYPAFASDEKRTRLLIKVLNANRYDIVGTQEFQPPQREDFLAWTENWGCYAHGANAVLWHKRRTRVLERFSVRVPYFSGHMKAQPGVIAHPVGMPHEQYGLISTHNPANVNGPAEKFRREGWAREREAALTLMEKRPNAKCVFVVGDKNDREYGEWVRKNGGKVSGFPDIRGIDWIAAWARQGVDLRFPHHSTFETERIDDMTDHPVTEATARF